LFKRGLRDDFRTLNWVEIVGSFGVELKKLDYFLAMR